MLRTLRRINAMVYRTRDLSTLNRRSFDRVGDSCLLHNSFRECAKKLTVVSFDLPQRGCDLEPRVAAPRSVSMLTCQDIYELDPPRVMIGPSQRSSYRE